jgi:hypothetical protein
MVQRCTEKNGFQRIIKMLPVIPHFSKSKYFLTVVWCIIIAVSQCDRSVTSEPRSLCAHCSLSLRSASHYRPHIFSVFESVGFVRYIALPPPPPTTGNLCVLYTTSVPPKLEYACVVWNSTTSTDSSERETVGRKSTALSYSRLSVGSRGNNHEGVSATLGLSALYSRRWCVLFLINDFQNKNSFTSILYSVSL